MTTYEQHRVKGRFAGLRRVCEVKRCHNPPAVTLGQGWASIDVCPAHARAVIGLPAPARWL